MDITGKQLIGNSFSAEETSHFRAVDPASGKDIPGRFFNATAGEIDRAVQKAESAFQSYRKCPDEKKAGFLNRIGEEILALGDVLIRRCMQETGLPEGRLKGERGRTVNQLNLFAELLREGSWVDARIDTPIPDREPAPKPDIRHMQIALGPVGIFGASNFPLAFSVAGGDTASALAAGCTVVVKGHPAHPGTSELVGRAILKAAESAGIPDGVFSLVQGASHETGQTLVKHPLVKAIGFTGSFRGGKALFETATRREEPIPVFAEMGSINPVFVLPEAAEKRKEQIARGLAASVTLGAGQFCTNPGLVAVMDSPESHTFIQKTGELLASSEPGTMLTSGIRKNYFSGVEKFRAIEGVSLVSHGKESQKETDNRATAFLLQATADAFLTHEELADEVFGPSSLVVTARDKQELSRLAENLRGHLTATIHGTEEDLEAYSDLVSVLERKVGRLIFNGYPTGVEVCHSMVHGGPWPATTDARTTSVGTTAIRRFTRPVCYQDFPQQALPDALKDPNPLRIWRLVDGTFTKDPV